MGGVSAEHRDGGCTPGSLQKGEDTITAEIRGRALEKKRINNDQETAIYFRNGTVKR